MWKSLGSGAQFSFNPHHGPVLELEEYVDSVRLRFGCAGPSESAPCAACQSGFLDSDAAHATCRALDEATMRSPPSPHSRCCSILTVPLRLRSPASSLAPTSDTPTSSPPFLAMRAPPWTFWICSPHAQQAGPDCTRSRLAAKLDFCDPHLPSLNSIARKRNFVSAEVVFWKRTARQIRSCCTPRFRRLPGIRDQRPLVCGLGPLHLGLWGFSR